MLLIYVIALDFQEQGQEACSLVFTSQEELQLGLIDLASNGLLKLYLMDNKPMFTLKMI